ncbi:TPA: phage antirepressor KilAC domain-containing protein [Clostridium botulinum]|nr:phage antirepressor KilAC domain-containing protein [Clostridium botulinum]HBJ1652830.1 phage antirepressor KilAC domain-containing protein [Clostridium botulinum]
MSKELMVVERENELFGKVRFVQINNKEYAFGVDVAKALGYVRASKAISDNCKGILVKDTIKNNGGYCEKLIPEGDIYRLIVKSKLPQAEKFERWVFDEVLPQIRQTGGYIPIKEEDSEAEIMAKALLIAQNTLEKKDKIIVNQRKEIEEKDKIIKEDKPLVDFATQVVKTSDNITMSQFAKVIKDENIKLGRNKLFEWLRNNTYLRANNEPYQRYIDMNIFVTTEKVIKTPYGDKLTFQTFVTPKGQIYLVEKLRKEFCLECNNKNIA